MRQVWVLGAVCVLVGLGVQPVSSLAVEDEEGSAADACVEVSTDHYHTCVAYCDGFECHLEENRDSNACTSLRANYERLSGKTSFPCDEGGEE